MPFETISTDLTNRVLTITINRPHKKNAFNVQQYNDIRDALRAARNDDDTGAVLLTGSGGAFSAGQDLSDMGATVNPQPGEIGGFAGYQEELITFDKPLLSAVNGVAVGIGVTTLFLSDIVYLAESARLRMPFVSLGIVPEAGSSLLLQQIVGPQVAAELLYTAGWISSERAQELGMCARVVPDDQLLDQMTELAETIAAQPPNSLRETKRLLMATRADALRAATEAEMDALVRTVGSPENMEAIMAFMEKRAPDFAKLRNPS